MCELQSPHRDPLSRDDLQASHPTARDLIAVQDDTRIAGVDGQVVFLNMRQFTGDIDRDWIVRREDGWIKKDCVIRLRNEQCLA